MHDVRVDKLLSVNATQVSYEIDRLLSVSYFPGCVRVVAFCILAIIPREAMNLTYAFLATACLFLSAAPLASAAPWTESNARWNMNTNRLAQDPSEYSGSWSGHKYFPSPSDWRDTAVYHVMLDRFSDGDPRNNDGKYGGYDVMNIGKRQGGDFKGLQENLDYIQALGFEAIWISGIFQNFENDYHGYGPIDYTLIDERLGTLAEFRDLVNAAHNRGMYIILDVVVNHLNDFYFPKGFRDKPAPFRMHEGEYKLEAVSESLGYEDFKVVNEYFSSGKYCDVYDYAGRKNVDSGEGSYWESDFHHNGDVSDSQNGWNQQLGEIYGFLDDLRTSHPRVQRKIIAMTKSLIASTDIDAIRMDTPMLVPLCFFKEWAPEIRSFADSLGKNNFAIFGEFYNSHYQAATMIGRGKERGHYGPNEFIDDTYVMDGGINYRLYHTFILPALYHGRDGFLDHAYQQLDWQLKVYDLKHPRKEDVRYRMLNFYDNHDQRRICITADGRLKNRLGMFIITMWPGIPLSYFGDDQGLCSYGTALEGHSRESFMTSLAWKDHPSPEGVNPATKNNFDMLNSNFTFLQRLLEVRRMYSALRRSNSLQQHWLEPENKNGIYAFSRSSEADDSHVLVAFNSSNEARTAGDLASGVSSPWPSGTTLVNALDREERYTVTANGTIVGLRLDPYEGKVIVSESIYSELSPHVARISPEHDSLVSNDSLDIRVTFSTKMKAESVRRALRLNGRPIRKAEFNAGLNEKTFTISFKDLAQGVHWISLKPGVESKDGRATSKGFRSRFRRARKDSVLAQQMFQQEDLINDGAIATGSPQVKLHHKADGAKYYRASNDGGWTWSEWLPYEEVSEWNLGQGNGFRRVVVQYWIDGSSAYRVEDWIDRHIHDGFGFE